MARRGSCFIFFLAEIACWAQISGPGQQPYPPGSQPYPPVYGPSGGTGIPGIPFPRKKKNTTTKDGKTQPVEDPNTKTLAGTVESADEKQLELTTDDHRALQVKLQPATKYLEKGKEIKVTDFQAGDRVEVKALADDQGVFTALSVTRTAGPKAAAAKPAEAPGAEGTKAKNTKEKEEEEAPQPSLTEVRKPDGDDAGTPKLKRGKPAPKKRAKSDDDDETAGAAPRMHAASTPEPTPEEAALRDSGRGASSVNAPVGAPGANGAPRQMPMPAPQGQMRPQDQVLAEAMQAALDFSSSLPNYTCQQFTTRYESTTRPTSWNAIDIVGAEVVIENGKESYRNITINNRKVNKKIEETGHSWSTGEFNTAALGVLASYDGTNFKKVRTETINHRQADVYDYTIAQERSRWKVIAPGQYYYPGYKGSVWIDKETKRVMRIESSARKMPEDFPFDMVESATDYDFVRIGQNSYLLPVHAEVLSCQRGTPNCSRNAIEFRNYKKFGSESTIMIDGPQPNN